jgi:hypothetical protein
MMVSVGLLVFGVLTRFLGIKHGEYRANRTGVCGWAETSPS